MARGKAHSDETKASVIAALLAGQGVNEVAREFGISPSLVSGWKKSGDSSEFEQVRIQKGERIEELTFNYLSKLLSGLTQQVEIVSSREYLAKQPAADVAVLHGVMADKAFRLLSALPSAGRDDPEATRENAAPGL